MAGAPAAGSRLVTGSDVGRRHSLAQGMAPGAGGLQLPGGPGRQTEEPSGGGRVTSES